MIADTAAFVAGVEARLAAEREAAQQAEEVKQAEGQRLCEQQAEFGAPAICRLLQDGWKRPVSNWPESMRPGERAKASDQLARFRKQKAREAAQLAMMRRPELSAHSLDVVAHAMAEAKAQYLARGLHMDAPDARSAIESAALAALSERAR
jgi:hypothetical protein